VQTASIDVHVQEAGEYVNLVTGAPGQADHNPRAFDLVYLETSTARGDITHFEKVMSSTPGSPQPGIDVKIVKEQTD
jgi:hypothetical protein